MASREKLHRRYLHHWLLLLLLLSTATALFNYLVDPYGLFNTQRIEGFNARKPLAASHVRITKPYQVLNQAPRTLIMGNSRPEIGLDPANPCWPPATRPIFNLSLPGSSIFLQARLIQHALTTEKVEHLLWGLDFIDFFKPHSHGNSHWIAPNRKLPHEKRNRVNSDGTINHGYTWHVIHDHFQALASLNAIKDSIITIIKQSNPFTSTIREDGFNPAFDYLEIIHWEGQWVLFAQKLEELNRIFSRKELTLYTPGNRWSPEFEDLQRMLEYTKTKDVKVTLFINPYHVEYLSTIAANGHWEAFEDWKRHLASLAAAAGVTLWDFGIVNPLTSEKIPARTDKKTTMRWFWEPAHYRKELGDLMLSQMLGQSCNPEPIPAVGKRLAPTNVETVLAQSRKRLEKHQLTIH
jgi:hypothetical protein